MAVNYSAVLWNKYKKLYDKWILLLVLFTLIILVGFQLVFRPNISVETLIIRTTAITAFLMLHIILIIGPLCRLNSKFLPLLYNRRHLGVSMFIIAAVHGIFCIIQFHALGDINPILSIFHSNLKYQEISQFPFQTLGFFALIILFIMAATSHDFWLKNLGPRIWKYLHMLVYLAYGLIIMHVATGILQFNNNPAYWIILIIGFVLISGLHLIAGFSQLLSNRKVNKKQNNDGFQYACSVDDIREDCAKIITMKNQEIAVFKYDGKLSAVHNVCKHQLGPLGEGKIIDGCITCPWHGYQYLPENGQSPPPFKEKIATYRTKVNKGEVWIDPIPREEGTYINPAKI